MITYKSTDIVARTVTFDIDGVTVVRGIADFVDDSSLNAHIEALARGLESEVPPKRGVLTKQPKFAADQVLVAGKPK